MTRLAAGLSSIGVEVLTEASANVVFARVAKQAADRIEASGLLFYRTGTNQIRLVTSFQTTLAEVDEALQRIAAAIG